MLNFPPQAEEQLSNAAKGLYFLTAFSITATPALAKQVNWTTTADRLMYSLTDTGRHATAEYLESVMRITWDLAASFLHLLLNYFHRRPFYIVVFGASFPCLLSSDHFDHQLNLWCRSAETWKLNSCLWRQITVVVGHFAFLWHLLVSVSAESLDSLIRIKWDLPASFLHSA